MNVLLRAMKPKAAGGVFARWVMGLVLLSLPLLVLLVLGADDVDVTFAADALFAYQQFVRRSGGRIKGNQIKSKPSVSPTDNLSCTSQEAYRNRTAKRKRTLHPSQNFLTLLRTFMPRVCVVCNPIAVAIDADVLWREGWRHAEVIVLVEKRDRGLRAWDVRVLVPRRRRGEKGEKGVGGVRVRVRMVLVVLKIEEIGGRAVRRDIFWGWVGGRG